MTVVNGRRLISNSEIQDFKQCPRKWWLAWYRGLAKKNEKQTGTKNTGIRLHECLAGLYVPEGQTPIHPLDTHDRITREILSELDPVEDMLYIAELQKDFALERVMLAGYMQWLAETGADEDWEVIGSEVFMQAPFWPGQCGGRGKNAYTDVDIIGRLDSRLRHRRTGRLRFMDHKSRDNLQPGMLRQNPQMLHYHLLEWLNAGDSGETCDGALYNMLKRSKRTARATPPFYDRVEITHNRHEMENYHKHLKHTIFDMGYAEHRLDAGSDHHEVAPPSPNDDTCRWKCPFVSICHMFDDGSRVEDALADRYTEIDPLSYYQGKEQGMNA